jgi:hypothetical protein
MPRATGRTLGTKRLFRRRERGSQVHLLSMEIGENHHHYTGGCNRTQGKPMVRTDETLTCHACIGIVRQWNLPEAKDNEKE